MVALWIIVVMLSLLTAIGGALIALRVQYWILDRTRREREAWQLAQEGRQRTWEVRQGKHMVEMESRLGEQVKRTRKDFRDWSLQIEEKQQILKARIDIEQELARLPHIEDVELPFNQNGLRQPPDRWRPPALYKADLSGRDLSHRYLGQADLRDATLTGANLYMADLSGATLVGANLENANLVGVNFAAADLRRANLSGANILVADLHGAVLHEAILQKMENFTVDQLQTALSDSTTVIDDSLIHPLSLQPSLSIASGGQEPSAPVSESETEVADPSIVIGETHQERAETVATPAEVSSETPREHDGAEAGAETEHGELEAESVRKIIQLATRTARSAPTPDTENKRAPKGTGNRGKRKGASRANKISRIDRAEGQQTRAN